MQEFLNFLTQYPAIVLAIVLAVIGWMLNLGQNKRFNRLEDRLEKSLTRLNDIALSHERELGRLEAGKLDK